MNFTKIKWAGEDCILVTETDKHCSRPILILNKTDIEDLNDEWAGY